MPRAVKLGPPKPRGWQKLRPDGTPYWRPHPYRGKYGPPKPPGWRKIHATRRPSQQRLRLVPPPGSTYAPCWCGTEFVLVSFAELARSTRSCGRRYCEGPDRVEAGVEYWEPTAPFCGWALPPEPLPLAS